MKYVGTKEQLADLLTKGFFSAVQWKTLCGLMQIGLPYTLVKPEASADQPQAGTKGNLKTENQNKIILLFQVFILFLHPQPFAA